MTNEDNIKLGRDVEWLKQQAAFLSAQSLEILQRLASLEASLNLSQRVTALEVKEAAKTATPA